MIKSQENELMIQANNCYTCKTPRCKKNCPISTPIPEIIELYKEGKTEEAGEILFNNNPLSSVCSVVCPHERTCKGNCIRGIKGEPVEFYKIEEYISGEFLKNPKLKIEDSLDEKVAIIGAGPSGIALAIILAQKGYKITIFEKNADIGGVLRYGIPEFRLSKEKINQIENILLQLNVNIRYNTLVGPVITLDKLLADGYNSVFIGTGVWSPKSLNIKGETLGNSHYAIDYLGSPASYKLGDKVVIIGAGNVAMDAARSAKYYGSKEVTIVYRKDFENMTATKAEIEETKEDGVKFELFKSPVEIKDEGIVFVDTKKIEDKSGNIIWDNIENSEKLIEADSIIIAVSQGPQNNIVSNTEDLKVDKYGLIITDKNGFTTKEGVFSAGDVVTGAHTVVEAVANAKKVAESIDIYCKEKRNN